MSRIGKMPIQIPSGVKVALDQGKITVSGPRGNLEQTKLKGVSISISDSEVNVERQNDSREARANHGLMRALINNMVIGVSQGFERKLELNGVGYRVVAQGPDLKFNLGFSHDVIYKILPDIKVDIDQNIITLSGASKQRVGQVAAEIRSLKKPEPYKGKGIKYLEERIIRKSGKSGKEATA